MSNKETDNQQGTRSHYQAPHLQQWGRVSDMTQAGLTNPGQDQFGGSVNAPGLENN
jgi:hypothetical protein